MQKLHIRRGTLLTFAQVIFAIAVFAQIVAVSATPGAPHGDCCPGTTQCEWQGACFDEGFALQGFRCQICGSSLCYWMPIGTAPVCPQPDSK